MFGYDAKQPLMALCCGGSAGNCEAGPGHEVVLLKEAKKVTIMIETLVSRRNICINKVTVSFDIAATKHPYLLYSSFRVLLVNVVLWFCVFAPGTSWA